jgi:hypothetical protein
VAWVPWKKDAVTQHTTKNLTKKSNLKYENTWINFWDNSCSNKTGWFSYRFFSINFLNTYPLETCIDPTTANLTFCTDISYPFKPSSDPSITNQVREHEVKFYFEKFRKLMAQYDCSPDADRYFYSSMVTCDDCLRAYKQWLCLVSYQECYGLKPCFSVCNLVVRHCPAHIQFHCPTPDSFTQFQLDPVPLSYSTEKETCILSNYGLKQPV